MFEWRENQMTPTAVEIEQAVAVAGLAALPAGAADKFAAYAALLLRWNARLNLTALRTPQQIVDRHFIECIFCAQHLAGNPATLLDYGSGAGFPGLPIALCRPEIAVTLAECNGKKASFLREAGRILDVPVDVYAGRVEVLPSARLFDAVTVRAVDGMEAARPHAIARVKRGGMLVLMSTASVELPRLHLACVERLPSSESRVLLQYRRL